MLLVALQATPLYSPDGLVYLVVQSDGNLVLYNTAKAGNNPGPSASFWSSGTYGRSTAPYQLNMQSVCSPDEASHALRACPHDVAAV